jgi:hypothetical protein
MPLLSNKKILPPSILMRSSDTGDTFKIIAHYQQNNYT